MDLLNPFLPKGPVEDHAYGNPIPAHVVYLKMASNFPPEAIQWVNRATWEGPLDIAWDNIDTDNVNGWAASRQPEKVQDFEQQIQAHDGNVEPSILIKDDDSPKSIIIDGHHRAIARHNLERPILGYVGRINPADRKAALETHTKQVHQGTDPQNKVSVNQLLDALDTFWYYREIGHPVNRREIFKALAALRDAGRAEFFLEREAAQFGWTLGQLDSPYLRSWLCD
jgi:hypothetical protein